MHGNSIYSDEIADEICARLENGESLQSICKSEHMPDERTVRRWATENYQEFSPRYARAREIGYLKLADEILDIADDARNDWMDRKTRDGTIRVVDEECVKRSQLRVESRKWLLAKMLPKVYGDKLQVDQNVSFSEEFETYIRELNERKNLKVINVAGEGPAMGNLPAPVRR
jgi:hypothetical protein